MITSIVVFEYNLFASLLVPSLTFPLTYTLGNFFHLLALVSVTLISPTYLITITEARLLP